MQLHPISLVSPALHGIHEGLCHIEVSPHVIVVRPTFNAYVVLGQYNATVVGVGVVGVGVVGVGVVGITGGGGGGGGHAPRLQD